MSIQITAAMLYDLVQCEHRPAMDLFGDPSKRNKISPFVRLLWEKGTAYEHEVIEELEEDNYSEDDQDVESGSFVLRNDGSGVDCLSLFGNVDPTVSRICFCFFLTLAFRSSVSMPSKIGEY